MSDRVQDGDAIMPFFLAQGEQRVEDVAARLATYIGGAYGIRPADGRLLTAKS